MPVLNPSQAASAALGVYQILNTGNLSNFFINAINANFDISKPLKFSGKSGFTLMQTTSAFGLAAMGSGNGYQQDALITIRGTDLSADWITDAHAGTAYYCGKIVHSGFYKVFQSILPAINAFFQIHHPLRVHVVGHSLGGAVATLIAQWIKQNNRGEPYLYTFGSPRVGYANFAHLCTVNLKSKNIYRVYHENDPVPMVPIQPFTHVPIPGRPYRVFYQPAGSPINPSAHMMTNYQSSISGKTWSALQQPIMIGLPDYAIEDWLASSNTVAGHLAYDLVHYSREAVFYILRKTGFIAESYVQNKIMTISNGLDMLAKAMEAGKKLANEIKEYILQLIRKIHAVLGIVTNKVKVITIDLIRWTIRQLEEVLYRMARTALRNAIPMNY